MPRVPHKGAHGNEMIRRFERSEIVLHWANAVPFLILFVTGALNILSRFVAFPPPVLMVLRAAHKAVGALWLVSILYSFFFVGRHLNIANLRDQICMGLSDIAWMIRAFRSIYNPHVPMPPAGKFNPGQKINALLVGLYVVAFTGSGALMWAFGTMLLPWFFHVAVFLMAAASLGGHLYLSFVHPSTRPGLAGIFTGMVPRSYVLHHHSLVLGGASAHQQVAPGTRSLLKAEIVLLVVLVVGGGFGVEVLGTMPKPDLKRGFESIVTPGDLSKAHSIPEIDDCRKCHEYLGEIPEGKCLSCHKMIQTRKEARAGYHGTTTDTCIHCHKEHPAKGGGIVHFDPEKFDHAVAAFKLEGKHRDAKCETCHKRKTSADGNNPAGYYVGLRFDACLDCHKDIHAGGFGEKKCEACHTVAGWKEKDLKFDHGSARFRLEGKHASVACDKCHKTPTPGAALGTAVFTGMKFNVCNDCHKDPHRGKLRGTCDSCHSAAGWKDKDLKFDHGSARFRLEGKHASVKCSQCHKVRTPGAALGTVAFAGVKFGRCSDCHRDPHRGELKATCSACHSAQGWKGKDLLFSHDRDADYRLDGKHRPVTCVKCHKTAKKDGSLNVSSFRTKHGSCADCHQDPHRGELKATCSACHSAQGWRDKELLFSHDRDARYRLEGKHRSVTCVKCHKTAKKDGSLNVSSFRAKHGSCADCHQDPHRGELEATCATCHSAQGWKGRDLRFDHVRNTKYKLEGKHQAVACVTCHASRTKDGVLQVTSFKVPEPQMCAPCHKHKHKGNGKFVVACDYCHHFTSWKKKGT